MEVEDTFDYNAWLRDFNEFGEDGEKYFSDALDEGIYSFFTRNKNNMSIAAF